MCGTVRWLLLTGVVAAVAASAGCGDDRSAEGAAGTAIAPSPTSACDVIDSEEVARVIASTVTVEENGPQYPVGCHWLAEGGGRVTLLVRSATTAENARNFYERDRQRFEAPVPLDVGDEAFTVDIAESRNATAVGRFRTWVLSVDSVEVAARVEVAKVVLGEALSAIDSGWAPVTDEVR